MLTYLIDELKGYALSMAALLPKLIMALLALAFFLVVGFSLRWLIRRRIARKSTSASIVSSFLGELTFWSLVLMGVFSALKTLGFSGLATSIVAGAGVSAIIFGFAFKDILENFLAGILLTIQKPFKLGDIIQVNGYKGPVKALELRSTHIRLADGRDIWIPNSQMVKSVLTNFTRNGLLRHEFIVSIAMKDDTEAARNAIISYLQTQQGILKNPAPNVIIEVLATSRVELKVMFWINQLNRHNIADPIAQGESIRSQMIRGTKDVLLKGGFNIP